MRNTVLYTPWPWTGRPNIQNDCRHTNTLNSLVHSWTKNVSHPALYSQHARRRNLLSRTLITRVLPQLEHGWKTNYLFRCRDIYRWLAKTVAMSPLKATCTNSWFLHEGDGIIKNEYGTLVNNNWQGTTEELWEKPTPLKTFSPQNSPTW